MMLDWETQRGIALAITGICTMCLALGMIVRAHRKQKIGWPVAWGLVIGLWLTSLAFANFVLMFFWFGWTDLNLHEPKMIVPLWVAAGFSIWVLKRWIRTESKEITKEIEGPVALMIEEVATVEHAAGVEEGKLIERANGTNETLS